METTKLTINFLINFLFIGIPQVFVFIFLALFLIKEKHYFKEKNLKSATMDIFIVGTLPTALFLNGLYYFTNLDFFLRMFLNSIIYFIFINQLIKFSIKDSLWNKHLKSYKPVKRHLPEKYKTNTKVLFRKETSKYIFTIENNLPKVKYKNKKGIYLSIILLMMAMYVLEVVTSFYLQYIIKIDINSLSSNIINTIFIAYPAIIIFAFSVYLGYIYVNTGDVTLFKIWKSNKKFRVTTYIQCITTFIFSALIYVFIVKDNVLYTLDINISLKIAISLYTILILHIIIPWVVICKKFMLKYKPNYGNNIKV